MTTEAAMYPGCSFELRLADGSSVGTVRFIDPADAQRVADLLQRGMADVRISAPEDADVAGHMANTWDLRLAGEDDTEGHAISIHFPSRSEAEAFRTRLLATGVLVGALVAGGVGAAALQGSADLAGSGAGTQAQAAAFDAGTTDTGTDQYVQNYSNMGAGAGAGTTDTGTDQYVQNYSNMGAGAGAGTTDTGTDEYVQNYTNMGAGAETGADDEKSDCGRNFGKRRR